MIVGGNIDGVARVMTTAIALEGGRAAARWPSPSGAHPARHGARR